MTYLKRMFRECDLLADTVAIYLIFFSARCFCIEVRSAVGCDAIRNMMPYACEPKVRGSFDDNNTTILCT